MQRVQSAVGCRKCGGFTVSRGLLCARCSTKGDGLKTLLLTVIVLQGVGVAGIYLWNSPSRASAPSEMIHVVDEAPPTASEVAAHENHKGWFYYATRDERIDDTTRHARLTSALEAAPATATPDGTLAQAVPDGTLAQAVPDGTLELRSSAIYGQSAVLTINRKPTDQGADQATLAVQFDGRPPVEFPAEESTDDRGIVVAVADYNRFTSAMQGAHAMVVDAQLGARTERILRFQVSGLNW